MLSFRSTFVQPETKSVPFPPQPGLPPWPCFVCGGALLPAPDPGPAAWPRPLSSDQDTSALFGFLLSADLLSPIVFLLLIDGGNTGSLCVCVVNSYWLCLTLWLFVGLCLFTGSQRVHL